MLNTCHNYYYHDVHVCHNDNDKLQQLEDNVMFLIMFLRIMYSLDYLHSSFLESTFMQPFMDIRFLFHSHKYSTRTDEGIKRASIICSSMQMCTMNTVHGRRISCDLTAWSYKYFFSAEINLNLQESALKLSPFLIVKLPRQQSFYI